MGYRSNVRIRLTEKDYKRLVDEFDKNGLKEKSNLLKDIDFFKKENKFEFHTPNNNGDFDLKSKDCVYLGWNDLKWYDGYEEVDFIMAFIRNCEHYAFARIGEDCGDVESEEKDFDPIYTITTADDTICDPTIESTLYFAKKNEQQEIEIIINKENTNNE